jgi:outer membrane protein assembly factor BamD
MYVHKICLYMKKINALEFVILSVLSVVLTSCGITQVPEGANAQETYEFAMEQFNDGDYLAAQLGFDKIKLQYPASIYADDAQYYLADINFSESKYILAAFNYSTLRRVYPQSEYAQKALFKTALSYYELSPSYDRDQEYTLKAIKTFSEFQAAYPNDSLYDEASKYIKELRNKLAYRELFTAELYRKIRSSRSALVYYQSVIDEYKDTDYFEDAIVGKIETLNYLGRNSETQKEIKFYKSQFPKGKLIGKVQEIESNIGKSQ